MACSFSFEVLLKLLPSLTCGSSTFHSPASISLMQGLTRGAAERPRECSCPSRSKVSRPGSITGAPLQSVPHGHRDTNTGPGSVAPHGWGRELPTRGHDNGSKAMINSNNPNTPPRGFMLLSFYAGKRKRKNKSGAARLTPACREDSSCLRGSGRLPLALHRGATAGGHATTSQADATAWRLTAATAGRVAA